MTVFFDDADARYLASLGMNSVRIPFNYRHFEDDARPFELSGSRIRAARPRDPALPAARPVRGP